MADKVTIKEFKSCKHCMLLRSCRSISRTKAMPRNLISAMTCMQIDFLLFTEQEKLNGCHTGPRTLHLGMQYEKILAPLKMDIAAINSKEFVSVTENNKTNPKCRENVMHKIS
nr:hypothetical protein CFP56_32741 [Quercus suber]